MNEENSGRNLYWYKITTKEMQDGKNYNYIGTSPLTEQKLLEVLAKGEPLQLNNLSYRSERGVHKWAEFWPGHSNRVIIMPGQITSVVPLEADWFTYQPKQEGGDLVSQLGQLFFEQDEKQ